jgi:hypothetical protein
MNTNNTDEILAIVKASVFFQKRFPDKFKNMRLEIRCGYFEEWVDRFQSGHPESYMDSESLAVYDEMKKEGLQ